MSRPLVRHALLLLTSSLPHVKWDAMQTRAYMKGLEDLDDALIYDAAVRLQKTHKFMPSVPEIREACAAIRSERRSLAIYQARALQAHCETCHGTGWEEVLIDGAFLAKRCACVEQGHELIKNAGAPIPRPTLPAAPPQPEDEEP